MDKQSPQISVVMSVYNGGKYVREAVESILNQTFTDFELIVIDDGSTDGTSEILASYNDSRIILLINEKNIGLPASLNKGISVARGDYIARMDADDVCLPERFGLQVKFLDNHPEIGVLGGNISIIDLLGVQIRTLNYLSSHAEIKWLMCFENPIAHSTVMMRTKLLNQLGGYLNYNASEDYDLWQRMSEVTKLANLSEIVLQYRVHENNICALPNKHRSAERNKVRQRAIESILGEHGVPHNENYWDNPYSTAIVIFRIYNKCSKGGTKTFRNYLRNRTVDLLFSRARAIDKSKIGKKIHAYSLAFFLEPSKALVLWHSILLRIKIQDAVDGL